jgi:hypothetical protein
MPKTGFINHGPRGFLFEKVISLRHFWLLWDMFKSPSNSSTP